MQINISTRHGHVSSETQDKLTAKLDKLSRYHERVTSVNATIELGHPETPEVELRVTVEHAKDFVATDGSGSLMACVDAAVQKLEQQLRKHQGKLTDRRTTGPSVRKMEGNEEESSSTSE